METYIESLVSYAMNKGLALPEDHVVLTNKLLMLRNNLTTKEHPLGVFHPHADKHHIKKENIGLIEVMGLAFLRFVETVNI